MIITYLCYFGFMNTFKKVKFSIILFEKGQVDVIISINSL